MQPRAVLADRLEDRVRADQVRLDERLRVVQRVVHVRLGREVHDHVALADQAVDERRVADVAVHELDLVLDRLQALAVARVGQGVEHDHLVLRVVAHRVVDEVRADEAGGAGDEQLHDASTSRGSDGRAGRPATTAARARRSGSSRGQSRRGAARGGRGRPRSRGARARTARRARRSRTARSHHVHWPPPATCRTPRRRCLGDLHQRRREMAGVGRAAELVVDHRDLVALGAEPQHRVDEVLAVRAEHPRGADDRVDRATRRHRELARELGAPVGADRAGRRVLAVRRRSRRPAKT